ncbi:glycoprotein endo-alpha-1,2-mannosidase-like protein [Sycon ciliatum]|uniref:glycoprotein endo-alpha-1,2-mannosidase-like protein n=1 Tax=Sycon ciliatum TaxID=27933 RepID=UPI0020AC6D4A|eukprot:scpid68659/ scgid22466/ Glycoprotein endo-alpha-1,2-mannosidase
MQLRRLPWRFARLVLLLCVVSPLLIYTAGYLSFRSVKQSPGNGLARDTDNHATNKQSQIPGGTTESASLKAPLVLSTDQQYQNLQKIRSPAPGTNDKDGLGATTAPVYSSRIHAFYYPWYASPAIEGKYLHWNHRILPFWGDKEAVKKPPHYHTPPGDIGAQFYPQLGIYSSRSLAVISAHMKQMKAAGVGVAAVSWYPPKLADDNGKPSDDVIPMLLKAGHEHGVSIAFHLEPYEPRSAKDVYNDLKYIIDTYGQHPAFYRTRLSAGTPSRPIVYAYDSYKIPTDQWKALLTEGGAMSIRASKYDCLMVGLVVNKNDLEKLHAAGFDGSYTYFASKTFTFGSNPENWKWLNELSAKLNMLFIPSIGPGYDDTAIRPWNADTRQVRAGGKYYRDMISAVLELDIEAISITSFNEWGEGTQIESAVPYTFINPHGSNRVYSDYQPLAPDGYLKITKEDLNHFVPARLF